MDGPAIGCASPPAGRSPPRASARRPRATARCARTPPGCARRLARRARACARSRRRPRSRRCARWRRRLGTRDGRARRAPAPGPRAAPERLQRAPHCRSRWQSRPRPVRAAVAAPADRSRAPPRSAPAHARLAATRAGWPRSAARQSATSGSPLKAAAPSAPAAASIRPMSSSAAPRRACRACRAASSSGPSTLPSTPKASAAERPAQIVTRELDTARSTFVWRRLRERLQQSGSPLRRRVGEAQIPADQTERRSGMRGCACRDARARWSGRRLDRVRRSRAPEPRLLHLGSVVRSAWLTCAPKPRHLRLRPMARSLRQACAPVPRHLRLRPVARSVRQARGLEPARCRLHSGSRPRGRRRPAHRPAAGNGEAAGRIEFDHLAYDPGPHAIAAQAPGQSLRGGQQLDLDQALARLPERLPAAAARPSAGRPSRGRARPPGGAAPRAPGAGVPARRGGADRAAAAPAHRGSGAPATSGRRAAPRRPAAGATQSGAPCRRSLRCARPDRRSRAAPPASPGPPADLSRAANTTHRCAARTNTAAATGRVQAKSSDAPSSTPAAALVGSLDWTYSVAGAGGPGAGTMPERAAAGGSGDAGSGAAGRAARAAPPLAEDAGGACASSAAACCMGRVTSAVRSAAIRWSSTRNTRALTPGCNSRRTLLRPSLRFALASWSQAPRRPASVVVSISPPRLKRMSTCRAAATASKVVGTGHSNTMRPKPSCTPARTLTCSADTAGGRSDTTMRPSRMAWRTVLPGARSSTTMRPSSTAWRTAIPGASSNASSRLSRPRCALLR